MFRYIPRPVLAGRPHVIIDGAPGGGTVFTLSHWPHTPTPAGLRADLSADIARAALRHRELLPSAVDVASVDHDDVDGLVALALVVEEGLDADHGPLLVEAARVGDFGVVTDPRAALVAFALQAVLSAGDGNGIEPGLALLADLASGPERYERLWGDEWSAYTASRRALDEGWATIEEVPELDLAVVRVDPRHAEAAAAWDAAPLHPAAVHSATSCLRVATVAGDRMELRYRYESWVRLSSRRPRPRVNLDRVAAELTAAEKDGSRWVFDGAAAVRGAVHMVTPGRPTTIAPDRFLELITERLAVLDQGPAAWDPYAESGHR